MSIAPTQRPPPIRPMPKDRRNEPAFLPHIAAELARDRDESPATVAQATTATAQAFFRLPD